MSTNIVKKAIEDAFSSEIKNMYSVLSRAYLSAGYNEQEKEKADEKFHAGLSHARSVRAAALKTAGLSDND